MLGTPEILSFHWFGHSSRVCVRCIKKHPRSFLGWKWNEFGGGCFLLNKDPHIEHEAKYSHNILGNRNLKIWFGKQTVPSRTNTHHHPSLDDGWFATVCPHRSVFCCLIQGGVEADFARSCHHLFLLPPSLLLILEVPSAPFHCLPFIARVGAMLSTFSDHRVLRWNSNWCSTLRRWRGSVRQQQDYC